MWLFQTITLHSLHSAVEFGGINILFLVSCSCFLHACFEIRSSGVNAMDVAVEIYTAGMSWLILLGFFAEELHK
jgi:hypothetical protein